MDEIAKEIAWAVVDPLCLRKFVPLAVEIGANTIINHIEQRDTINRLREDISNIRGVSEQIANERDIYERTLEGTTRAVFNVGSTIPVIRRSHNDIVASNLPTDSRFRELNRQGMTEDLMPSGQSISSLLINAGTVPNRGVLSIVLPVQLSPSETDSIVRSMRLERQPIDQGFSFYPGRPSNIVFQTDPHQIPYEMTTYFCGQMGSLESAITVSFPRGEALDHEPTVNHHIARLLQILDERHGPIGIYAPPGPPDSAVAIFYRDGIATRPSQR